MDSCVTSSLERFSSKPDKARGQNLPLGIVGYIFFWLSLLQQVNACFTIVAIDQRPRKAKSSPIFRSLMRFCQAL